MVTTMLMVRHVLALVRLHVGARHCFVHQGVEHLFFPAVGFCTVCLQGAAVFILWDEIASLPLFTEYERVVIKKMGFSSEILPVMGIDTLSFIVFMSKRTPFSLEVKRIKFPRGHNFLLTLLSHGLANDLLSFLISDQFMNKRRLNILFIMRKRTIVSILAFWKRFWTKFELISIRMIQMFSLVMWQLTFCVSTVINFITQFFKIKSSATSV
jgi:hypothetical protein